MTDFHSYRSYFDFALAVTTKRRFIYDEKTAEFISAISHSCQNYTNQIKKNSILFRAQRGCDSRPVYDQETGEHIADDDWPYSKKRMFPIKNMSFAGRANPRGISFPYLSNDRDTACAEVRPWKGQILSFGLFQVKRDLKIVDFSRVTKKSHIYFEEPEPSTREECVWSNINNAFSKPVNPNDPEIEYIPTQIIAEIIRKQGYDGIAYKSSLGKGYNIVLFDVDTVEIIGCWLTKTKDIFFDFEHRKIGYGKIIKDSKKDHGSLYKAYHIIFENSEPIPSQKITKYINKFGGAYAETIRVIIKETNSPHLNKDIFIRNTATLLNSFGMARSGPFKGIGFYEGKYKGPIQKLEACWDSINEDILLIRKFLNERKFTPRSRTLVLLDKDSRDLVVSYVWKTFKKLLPITMGKNSFGLVGASKILFSVLPEIVLPVDNAEWLTVFKTVDIADIINLMADEILAWEFKTGQQLQQCDYNEITTLPSIYNVMAVKARP